MPGGMAARIVCESAVICAMARSIFTFGWKKTRTTETPVYDVAIRCARYR